MAAVPPPWMLHSRPLSDSADTSWRQHAPPNRRQDLTSMYAPTGRHPSRGSKNHFLGQCRPCFFHHSADGCSQGNECNFCHYQHDASKLAELFMSSSKAKARRAQLRVAQQAHLESSWGNLAGPTYLRTDAADTLKGPDGYVPHELSSLAPNAEELPPPLGIWASELRRRAAAFASVGEELE